MTDQHITLDPDAIPATTAQSGATTRRGLFRRAGLVGAAAVAGFAAPAVIGTAFPQPAHAWVSGWNYRISRQEVLNRAFSWVNNPRAYSMTSSSMGPEQMSSVLWRQDCSGFVSMALGIRHSDNPTGLTTETLHPDGGYGISSSVAASSLLPGDFLVRKNADSANDIGHVVLFNGWASDTTYYAVEQMYPDGTVSRTRTYSADINAYYRPFRYVNIYGS
ncbi:hypothetical protein [Sediminivirga luteola]|uniref:Uncharacterized protein n=1 Tax=Sediminivirga luteola TaxID=1774748 RepID=A0A8J2XIS0_9MICO|nr:hypothetical protein [Sediminivirga luteola]GGA04072.1 hypothetical protein GCM10011333_03580 [Sediminivirga luteola]